MRRIITEKLLLERKEKAKQIHNNKYDYSKSDFSLVKNKTTIFCPIHGDFEMDYDHHVNSRNGCPKCSGHYQLTEDDYIERVKKIHKDKYIYDNIQYKNMHDYIYPICKEHGIFKVNPQSHLRGCGCQKCKINSLEDSISSELKKNGIEYLSQVNKNKFNWLGCLSLDFYIPSKNIAIECQGKQHFREGGWIKDNLKREAYFNEQIERDKRKFNLCKNNGVKLLYFSNMQPKFDYFDKVYTNLNEIIQIIKEK